MHVPLCISVRVDHACVFVSARLCLCVYLILVANWCSLLVCCLVYLCDLCAVRVNEGHLFRDRLIY